MYLWITQSTVMNTNNIPQELTNIPLGQIFILTNPKVGITAKTIQMMEFILSMARQYDQEHIVNTLPVDDPKLWDCFICKVKTEDGDQILVSDKDTLVEMLCEFWGLDYDEVCKTIVIPKRNKTVTFGGERHPVRMPAAKPVLGVKREEYGVILQQIQDHTKEGTLEGVKRLFLENFNFNLGISLDEFIDTYKEVEQSIKKYRLDIQFKWKKEYKHPKWVIKMRECEISLIDNLGNRYPIKVDAENRVIYLTFLFFEDGIPYTQITTSDEFYKIYKQIHSRMPRIKSNPKRYNLEDKEDLATFTNYISKIRKAILNVTNDIYAVEQFAVEGRKKDNYGIAGATDENRDVVRKAFKIK